MRSLEEYLIPHDKLFSFPQKFNPLQNNQDNHKNEMKMKTSKFKISVYPNRLTG